MKLRHLFEETTPYDNPKNDIGLMTRDEFLKFRNSSEKMHPDNAYDFNLSKMNQDYSKRIVSPYRVFDKIETTDRGMMIYVKDKLSGIMVDDTLYYNIYFPIENLPYIEPKVEIRPKNKKKVKYITDYVHLVDNVVERNMKRYPKLMNRTKIGGNYFEIRTEKETYTENSGQTIAIVNEEGYVVAQASDEWGTTLLTVAQEYRGYGLGKVIGKIWYDRNPKYMSGGFTASGMRNALKIWQDRVRQMLANGWYSSLVKQGKISKEKVREIVSQLEKDYPIRQSEKQTKKTEPLILVNDFAFTIYDKKFFNEPDEKYIYAHGFFRDNNNGDLFLFSIDYDKGFEKIASYVALQLAKNQGSKIFIADKPSDTVEFDDLEGVTVEDVYAYLENDILDLNKYSRYETQYRKDHDQYDEAYYRLQELADSKWD
jgi:hypothetical protein